MRPFTHGILVSCVALSVSVGASLCLSFGPATQDPKPEKPAAPALSKGAVEALVDSMQGAWRLAKYDAPAMEKKQRQEVGFLLVSGSYFSFEMHLGWTTANGTPLEQTFVSGTHRFEIDENSRLNASSVIGASMDDDNRVQFEVPGRTRRYGLVCSGPRLTLTREDGTVLEFEKMADTRQKLDAFGRPLKLKDPNAKSDGGEKRDPEPRKKD